MKKVKQILIPLVFIASVALLFVSAYAHSGGTDSKGGHHVSATGEYHYHHGQPAHQHPNGVCPYDNDDEKEESQGPSNVQTAESFTDQKNDDNHKIDWGDVITFIIVIVPMIAFYGYFTIAIIIECLKDLFRKIR